MASLLVTREPFATALRCQAGGNVHIWDSAFLGAGELAVRALRPGRGRMSDGALSAIVYDAPEAIAAAGGPARA
ncbi:hypothetical protein SMC5_09900, partial [Candidatus Cryosericum odellii]